MDDNLPKSIIIAGGGAIGCEFAYVHHNYGVDVTIVEFLDHLLPLEDEEVSAELEKQYKKLGIKVMTKTRVDKIEDTGKGAKVTVTTADGKQQVLEADRVLAGDRLQAAHRRLRAGENRRQADRARRDCHQRARCRPTSRTSTRLAT